MNKYLVIGILMLTGVAQVTRAASGLGWKSDVTDVAIPVTAAQGMANGVKFTLEKASLKNGILKLRQGQEFFADEEFTIFTFLKAGETIEGKQFMVKPGDGFGSPHIHFGYKVADKKIPETKIFMKGYAMKLQFDYKTGNQITGKIYLCLPDEKKSYVVGTFTAEME